MTSPSPAIPTFVDGSVPTAGDLNTLSTNIGNLYAYSQAGFRVRRPIVEVRVNRANREILTDVETLITFDETDIDTDHLWSGVVSEVIFINTPGLYRVGLQAVIQPLTVAAGSVVSCRIARSVGEAPPVVGTDAIAVGYSPGLSQSFAGMAVSCGTVTQLNADDRLRCYVTHTIGATAALDPAFGGTRMFAVWLGPL